MTARPITVSTDRRQFFTPRSLADHLSISERTVRQMLADGVIPSYLIGSARRISPEDVDRYLAGCRELRMRDGC